MRSEVAEKIQDLIKEQSNGMSLTFNNGYRIEMSKWGQKRKSYHLSVCKPNDNCFQHVGVIEERHAELFKEVFESNKTN